MNNTITELNNILGPAFEKHIKLHSKDINYILGKNTLGGGIEAVTGIDLGELSVTTATGNCDAFALKAPIMGQLKVQKIVVEGKKTYQHVIRTIIPYTLAIQLINNEHLTDMYTAEVVKGFFESITVNLSKELIVQIPEVATAVRPGPGNVIIQELENAAGYEVRMYTVMAYRSDAKEVE